MSLISIEVYVEHLERYRQNLDKILSEVDSAISQHLEMGTLSMTDGKKFKEIARQKVLHRKEATLDLEDYIHYLDDVDTKGQYPTYVELLADLCPLSYKLDDLEFNMFMTKCLPCHRDW